MCSVMVSRNSDGRSKSERNTRLTLRSASSGHGVNQSMTVLLTSPGKLRHRVRSTSPTGDIASTTCRLLRHRST